MDFQFTPEQLAFREQVTQWIQENLPSGWEDRAGDLESPENIEIAREFRRKLAAKGWLALGWPEEYGGRGADVMTQVVFEEVSAYLGAPSLDSAIQALGPILMAHGTEEQKQRWLKGIAEGRWSWAQLYSEPGAGSDLASLQTRAVEEEGDFVINGSKNWSSAHAGADMAFLLARTNPDAPKHQGISLFIVDMSSLGVQVSKLPTMGEGGWGLVYFDNVRMPKANLVGERGQGWPIVAASLAYDRSSVQQAATVQRLLDRLVEMGREATGADGEPAASHPVMRHRLARSAIEIEVLRMLGYEIAWLQSQGQAPIKEVSIARVFGAEVLQRVVLAGMQMMGLYQNARIEDRWAPLRGQIAHQYWIAFSGGVAGGSSEVHRNIIATRGLGLPRG